MQTWCSLYENKKLVLLKLIFHFPYLGNCDKIAGASIF